MKPFCGNLLKKLASPRLYVTLIANSGLIAKIAVWKIFFLPLSLKKTVAAIANMDLIAKTVLLYITENLVFFSSHSTQAHHSKFK